MEPPACTFKQLWDNMIQKVSKGPRYLKVQASGWGDKLTHRQTDTDINTMSRPGL